MSGDPYLYDLTERSQYFEALLGRQSHRTAELHRALTDVLAAFTEFVAWHDRITERHVPCMCDSVEPCAFCTDEMRAWARADVARVAARRVLDGEASK